MSQRSTLFLMANLGSAISRALSFLENDEKELFEKAKEECLKIIGEILENNDSKGAVAEASILKDLLLQKEGKKLGNSVKRSELNAYFSPFSLRLLQKQ
jgi:uncharacterized alpha/beta hydrolase family protein